MFQKNKIKSKRDLRGFVEHYITLTIIYSRSIIDSSMKKYTMLEELKDLLETNFPKNIGI